MELTLCAPRLMTIEKRIAHNPKFFSRLARLPKPPLKTEEAYFKPGKPEPPDRGAGTLTVCVIQTSPEIVAAEARELAFTPAEAGPGGPTAAAESPASTPQLSTSSPTRAVTKTAPRPKKKKAAAGPRPRGARPKTRLPTTAALLREIARLERKKRELERGQARGPAKNAFCGGQRPSRPGLRPGMAGPGRKPRKRDGRAT